MVGFLKNRKPTVYSRTQKEEIALPFSEIQERRCLNQTIWIHGCSCERLHHAYKTDLFVSLNAAGNSRLLGTHK